MKKFPTLYKKTSTGAVQQWTIGVLSNEDGVLICTTYGQVDGQMQNAFVKVDKGKNIGKSNETTPYEQACLEAESKWKKQLDKGYREQLDEEVLTDAMSIKPMLAHPYEKYQHKVTFPALIQPKFDGERCLAFREEQEVRLVSRNGKPITTVPHVNAALMRMMNDGEIWDGELYAHGVAFRDFAKWIKKHRPESANISFYVYDCISDLPFELRYHIVDCKIENFADEYASEHYEEGSDLPPLPVYSVVTVSVNSVEEMEKRRDEFISQGYEGAMLRVGDCTYKAGYRSQQLLKLKLWMDEEFKIVDVVDGKGKMAGKAIFVCKGENGKTFNCVPDGDDETRAAYWKDRKNLIGKMLTVKFQEWYDKENRIPRFPNGKVVRDYE